MSCKYFALTLLIFSVMQVSQQACSHPIFCNDEILTAVANSNYFEDSKTFVDLVLTVSIDEAKRVFESKSIEQFIQ